MIAVNDHSTNQTDPRAVFNGELVNYRSLRSSLILREVRGHSDTALILSLFTSTGDQFVKSLAAMFAIAAYDERRRQLKLLRDPLDVKPLYYIQTANYVMFSSQIMAAFSGRLSYWNSGPAI